AALDIVCDLHDLAVSDATYDVVICSQVLEHLPDPEHVLRELHRVLKPNGRLWLSTPLFFEEHEVPHDYYRYTRYGLRYLLEKSGFQIQQMAWLEGYYGTIAYQLKTMALALPRTPQDYGGDSISYLLLPFMVLLKVIFGGLTVFFTRLDLRYKYTERGHCKNYAAVAVKLPSTRKRFVVLLVCLLLLLAKSTAAVVDAPPARNSNRLYLPTAPIVAPPAHDEP
ncbi:MAG: class I SAM-dependent methyltransferase, partial [Caldilineaceae bacterium]|nr:class I SAM-dependent methyltransferase [Caldilineaceae bacterium]